MVAQVPNRLVDDGGYPDGGAVHDDFERILLGGAGDDLGGGHIYAAQVVADVGLEHAEGVAVKGTAGSH